MWCRCVPMFLAIVAGTSSLLEGGSYWAMCIRMDEHCHGTVPTTVSKWIAESAVSSLSERLAASVKGGCNTTSGDHHSVIHDESWHDSMPTIGCH